jgi:ParB-like chromosome segregation protein Spo0J
MTQEQYVALKIDIENNGQIDPVILYRGRIIDGRHRLKIAKELGQIQILTVSIPNNSTINDIRAIVKSKEELVELNERLESIFQSKA